MGVKMKPETLYGFYLNDRVVDLASTSSVHGIRHLTGSVVRLTKGGVLHVLWDSGRLERFSAAADSWIKKIDAGEDW